MKLPQIHLRDLFWLAVVVGMGLGWWAEHRRYLDYRVTEENTLAALRASELKSQQAFLQALQVIRKEAHEEYEKEIKKLKAASPRNN